MATANGNDHAFIVEWLRTLADQIERREVTFKVTPNMLNVVVAGGGPARYQLDLWVDSYLRTKSPYAVTKVERL